MEYKNYEVKAKSDVVDLITSGKQDLIIEGIIGGVNGIDDWNWIQDVCISLIYHSNFWISKTAITSLGDIARMHKEIEKEKVLKALESISKPKLSEVVSMVKEDIEIFITQE